MKKTLGGDRLGGGQKMKVDLRTYNRSTHNKSFVWRSTMASGTLVPFLVELALPGSTHDIDLNIDVKTSPTVGPLFGTFDVRADIFTADMRLYNGKLHMNKQRFDPTEIKFPQAVIPAPTDITKIQSQINPSSIFSYLGLSGLGKFFDESTPKIFHRDINAMPWLMYWDCYKNYYANQQEEEGAVLHTPVPTINETITAAAVQIGSETPVSLPEEPSTTSIALYYTSKLIINYTGTQPDPLNDFVVTIDGIVYKPLEVWLSYTPGSGTMIFDGINYGFVGKQIQNWGYTANTVPAEGLPEIVRFSLSDLDDILLDILSNASNSTAFTIDNTSTYEPFNLALEENETDGRTSLQYNQEGLALKTYKSDINNNWLNTEWMEEINDASAVSTVGETFTIDDLMFRRKLYDYLLRTAVAGATYEDYIDVTYTVQNNWRPEKPVYHGSLIKELVFDEVVSNAASGDEPLGQLAGRGVMGRKHKGGRITIKSKEAAYIMGIVSITPNIDYSQGNAFDLNLKTFDDLHKPAFDQIGFQDKVTDTMFYADTDVDIYGTPIYKSIGKQPAWINYMTRTNVVKGNFAIPNNQMFMTLNRRYEWDEETETVTDFTTYIDPSKFNFIFADVALDAQNYWVQIAIGMEARMVMSAKVMPTL